MRKAVFGDHKGASDVYLVHEIIPLHVLAKRTHKVDSRCIVDQDIDSSKSVHNFLDALLDALLVADVALQRKSLPSCLDNLFCCGIDGSCIFLCLPGNLG